MNSTTVINPSSTLTVVKQAERIVVLGLGYVGLPLALALAKEYQQTIGFDINLSKVNKLGQGLDPSGEVSREVLRATKLRWSSETQVLAEANFIIVAVPTPIDNNRKPDLMPLKRASEMIGKYLQPGTIVVYESTVYPGVTEEVCGPLLEKVSGLKRGLDFKLGYSPERINPGDQEHSLENVVKIVAAEDEESLERVVSVYSSVVKAGIYRAPSIKVAEAAKVIENVQRDLNIALMNELAMIFDRLGLSTHEVLEAAGTKWNFLPFKPGLVGGHCIGIDPYYLITRAEELGYHPHVIQSARRINERMGGFVAQRLIKLLSHGATPIHQAKVGILGFTYKENVTDIRNSRVPEIITELRQYGIDPLVHDPRADTSEAELEYGIRLSSWKAFKDLDAIIFAVPHKQYLDMPYEKRFAGLKSDGVLIDVKACLDKQELADGVRYWSL